MKVRKKTDFNDEKSRLVFRIFDRTLPVFGELPFDIIFYLGAETEVIYDEQERVTTIILNYYDKFVQEGDEKGVFSRLLFLLHLAVAKQQDMPEILDEIVAGRRMALRNAEELFYTMYVDTATQLAPQKLEEYVNALVPYFVFAKIDAYNANLLLAMVHNAEKFQAEHKKIFSALTSRLDTEKSIANALDALEQNSLIS